MLNYIHCNHPKHFTQMGTSKSNAAFLISVNHISNSICRVVFSWFSDRECVNRLFLYNMALTFCGIGASLSIFYLNYEMLVALFGIFIGELVKVES